jgi:3-oxoacyl-[acyl-carrier protein] reductase
MVAIVSGGGRGLGAALVDDLLRDGHCVASFSRTTTPFIERHLATAGDRLFWQEVDGAEPEDLKRFALATARRFGRIDALVNNAAFAIDGLLTLTRSSDIRRVIAVNLEGAIVLTQVCAKVMLTRKLGTIVNVSSINSIRGQVGVSVYSATKAGLDGMCRSLAKELGPGGIRVNSVAPGYFESEMTLALGEEQKKRILRRTPLRRLATIENIVKSIRFLLSPDSAFITGQTLVVDGGLTC